ncbi:MAG: amidoligase family protein [Turicibacter sp.]
MSIPLTNFVNNPPKFRFESYFPGCPTKDFLVDNPVGIEIETEWSEGGVINNFNFWSFVEDGSLKNHGLEYISVPVKKEWLEGAIQEITPILNHPNLEWSHRCSIHVHLNVSTLSVEQFHGLVASYIVLEELFFQLVAPHRKGNAYCYPINDYPFNKHNIFGQDNKYCAFNCAPVSKQMTVEFRHMHGHSDVALLRKWIKCIYALYEFVINNSPERIEQIIMNLNSSSEYSLFVSSVFKELTELFDLTELQKKMEMSVLAAKFYLASE